MQLRHGLVLLLVLVQLGCQSPDPLSAAKHRSGVLIDSLMAESGSPGVAVAVGIEGDLLWSAGFGYANVETRTPVDPAVTRFRVGSVSKPMTAAALGQLLDAGKLDLDAPVQEYVPSFPEKRWPVTTRLVAGHLNGIRSYRNQEFMSTDHYASVNHGLILFRDDTLLHEPGTRYAYSSYGWNLLSAVVEGASGEGFLPYMQTHVFDPLGMQQTTADHVDSILVGRTGYYRIEKSGVLVNERAVDNSYKWAGGGFLSTAEDLVRFGFGHLQGQIMSPETIELFQTSQTTLDGETTNYGIGWSLGTDAFGRRRVGHGGGSVGGSTTFWTYPDEDLVFVMISNLSGFKAGNVPDEIVNLFLSAQKDP